MDARRPTHWLRWFANSLALFPRGQDYSATLLARSVLGWDNSKHFANSRTGTSGISASSLSPKISSKNRIFSNIRSVIVFFRRRAIETSLSTGKQRRSVVTVERHDEIIGTWFDDLRWRRKFLKVVPLGVEQTICLILKSRVFWLFQRHDCQQNPTHLELTCV